MGWGRGSSYIEVLQQRAGSMKSKDSCLLKENQISQVEVFNGFLSVYCSVQSLSRA